MKLPSPTPLTLPPTPQFRVIQQDAEKNWHLLLNDLAELGDRFLHTVKAAWEAFNAPRPRA